MKKAIEFAHDVLINKISTQDIFVDMTMGNGNDTLFLCKIAKFVYAFDIQQIALDNTKKKLIDNDLSNYSLILDTHENIDLYIKESVKGFIYNLGYLPTGDKNIVDRHEYVLVFSKKSNFVINKAVQKMFADYKNTSINGGALWNINRKAGSVGKKYIHPAIYPNELVSRILLVSSQTYDLVVDPFLGSGTSLISALNNKRNFIGYEYNEGFKDLMQSRFEKEIMNFCDVEYMEF